MLRKFTNACINITSKWLPDPFIFAVILTVILFVVGIGVNGETPYAMLVHWGDGFWGLLPFAMQMTLVVMLGNCLASAPFFKKILQKLATIPKTPKQAVAFCTLVTGICCLIQWGFGLVVGAIFAKELAKKVKGVDFRLLAASAYSTFMLTVLTSSITLKAASNPEELAKISGGAYTSVIPLSQTAYHPATLIALVIMLTTLPLLNASMHPSPEKTVSIDPKLLEEDERIENSRSARKVEKNFANWIENSSLIPILIFIGGAIYTYHHFVVKGLSLNIDIMNFMLLILGLLLHKSPINYINAMKQAAISSSGIILQFPFYAGIMGMMLGNNPDGISIGALLTDRLIGSSTQTTLPFATFISASIVNMFIPSAGGQWAVQAPVMLPAAKALNMNPGIVVTALCWGDTWTNMIQPFWALPILGIAKLGVRDIMGFMVSIFLWTGIIIVGSLLLWIYAFGVI